MPNGPVLRPACFDPAVDDEDGEVVAVCPWGAGAGAGESALTSTTARMVTASATIGP